MVSFRRAAATVYLGRKTVAVPPFFVLNKTSGVLSFPTGCLPEISINHYIFVFLP
jgi:hypothetical protein